MKIPAFETKKELFDFLVKNKETLIAQKKAEIKKSDGQPYSQSFINEKGEFDYSYHDRMNWREQINHVITELKENRSFSSLTLLYKRSFQEDYKSA